MKMNFELGHDKSNLLQEYSDAEINKMLGADFSFGNKVILVHEKTADNKSVEKCQTCVSSNFTRI